jgi:uncharacterized protein (DUF1919 family)
MKSIKQIKSRLRWLLRVDSREWLNSCFSKTRQKKLKGTDFTIISNNCWAGHVYRRYGINYNTPTVGMYFFPEDYLRFVSNLRENVDLPITFIPASQSKYYQRLKELKQTNVPIAKLGDEIEIVMLHYHSEQEVVNKWNRRKKRINWEHLLVKNTMQNNMTMEQVMRYDELPFQHKIIFVPKKMDNIKSAIWYKSDCRDDQVADDIINFNKYINLTKWINSCY